MERPLVIFDPDPQSQAALAFGFRRAGFTVFATESAAEVEAVVAKSAPELLFISSSSAHGANNDVPLRLVGRLRQEEATRQLPVIVFGDRSAREPALRAGADEFVARPAYLRDVVTLARLTVHGRPTIELSTSMLVRLEHVARALSSAQRTGTLEIARGAEFGEVGFDQGEIVSAIVGVYAGSEALQRICRWGDAEVFFRSEAPGRGHRIDRPTPSLLRDLAEWSQAVELGAAAVGGLTARYYAASPSGDLPPPLAEFRSYFVGESTLIDFLDRSGIESTDGFAVVESLLALGLIERVDRAAGSIGALGAAALQWLEQEISSDASIGGVAKEVAKTPLSVSVQPVAPQQAAPVVASFNEAEEDFFAREADFRKIDPVDTFSDLDEGPSKRSERRRTSRR